MDLDHTDSNASELVRARDVLPNAISILPQAERPFFPGQVIPLLVDINE